MDIPVEIFHEILSHLPVTDIVRVENALDIGIPEYLYLRIHKEKFKSSLNEIKCVEYYHSVLSNGYTAVCIRKIGKDEEKTWNCIYAYYHRAQTYEYSKFRTGREDSNLLSIFTHKLSKSFTDCVDSTNMELFTVRKKEHSPTIFLMPKGNKARFGLGNFSVHSDFVDLSYGIIFAENTIY